MISASEARKVAEAQVIPRIGRQISEAAEHGHKSVSIRTPRLVDVSAILITFRDLGYVATYDSQAHAIVLDWSNA